MKSSRTRRRSDWGGARDTADGNAEVICTGACVPQDAPRAHMQQFGRMDKPQVYPRPSAFPQALERGSGAVICHREHTRCLFDAQAVEHNLADRHRAR
eukprot:CAMPEP_0115857578 /NCGR_PEP_ID=MMETSP0287-20121206/15647_1 /TAXON_ID=412157 /ORGANISM="Chrysochromulina rotalis, Strain UIO044" /LENGTH=97 /DNA_ID=CAMNT_0003311801 /DNA_START=312 /DNA_END=605 /DNA_ORIENTATION=-